jgi:hypothetical protein
VLIDAVDARVVERVIEDNPETSLSGE